MTDTPKDGDETEDKNVSAQDEFAAIAAMMKIIDPLDSKCRSRIICYIVDRFDIHPARWRKHRS